jgi:A/G-specific adenine glycosylase
VAEETADATAGDAGLVGPLLRWFRLRDRALPWRRTYDPYHVWLSEIMLQQTQMERGVAYFLRWLKRFGDVRAVAAASEQEILAAWQGLGYYARARNLHRAAKEIVARFDGVVPCQYELLRGLPGIGPYTAAAIASVAGNEDIPVVDANVLRVFARIFDLAQPIEARETREWVATLAATLLPPGQARAYNQALMDLGGLICTPRRPRCPDCPVAPCCRARQAGTVSDRPVRRPRRDPVRLEKVAGLIVNAGRLFIQQRPPAALWGGLWEFPGGELAAGELPRTKLPAMVSADCGLAVEVCRVIPPVKHQYTHHRVVLHGFVCVLADTRRQPVCRSAIAWQWLPLEELSRYAFPAGPRKLLAMARQNDLLRLAD